jgi:ABC-2 type transport system permease protein
MPVTHRPPPTFAREKTTVLTLISTEFLKLRTIRGPWLLLAAGPLLVIGGITGVVVSGDDVTRPETADKAVAHVGLMAVLALMFGIMAVAGEYRHKTITDTYLATPRRGRVIAAKLAVYTTAGVVFGIVLAATALAATAVAFGAKGGSLDLSGAGVWRTLVGDIVWNAAFTAIGVAVGALIRNPAAALATALAWIAVVEGLIGQLIGDLGRWLPFAAGRALGLVPGAGELPQWGGGLLLAGYAAAFALVAVATSVRRDIT